MSAPAPVTVNTNNGNIGFTVNGKIYESFDLNVALKQFRKDKMANTEIQGLRSKLNTTTRRSVPSYNRAAYNKAILNKSTAKQARNALRASQPYFGKTIEYATKDLEVRKAREAKKHLEQSKLMADKAAKEKKNSQAKAEWALKKKCGWKQSVWGFTTPYDIAPTNPTPGCSAADIASISAPRAQAGGTRKNRKH